MAGVAARIAGDRAQAYTSPHVASVVDERPRTVERGGTQKIGTPPDDVARRVANAAADAFDAGVGGNALGRAGRYARKIIASGALAGELALCARPFLEEFAHVGDEIADDRQVGKRRDSQRVAGHHVCDVRATGPA